MDWSKGYMSKCYISFVDERSWLDRDTLDITGGSIRRSSDDLQESASIDCVAYPTVMEQWVRVWIDAVQDGDYAHEAIFTGLATSPGRDIDGAYETNTIECYSVLKPAQDILLPLGWYAPAEAYGADLVKELLSVIPAPIDDIPEQSPAIPEAIVAESGESHLSMAVKILYAIGWELRITGYGHVRIVPMSSDIVSVFDATVNDIIEPHVTVTFDWYACPNVLRVSTPDGVSATVRDEDEDSPLSVGNRGREIWAEETNVSVGSEETLGEYALRRLRELQQVNTIVSYDRRFVPDISLGDRVIINYPAQNISGEYVITSQTIQLGYSATTSEEAQMA